MNDPRIAPFRRAVFCYEKMRLVASTRCKTCEHQHGYAFTEGADLFFGPVCDLARTPYKAVEPLGGYK